MSNAHTGIVKGIEFTFKSFTIQKEFDIEHRPTEFEWVEFGEVYIPVAVNPHETEPVVVASQIEGEFNDVVGFPIERLLENHDKKEPLKLDITLLNIADVRIKLKSVVLTSLPEFAQTKGSIDKIEFHALEMAVE